jgi:hypothetical protein
VGHGCSSAGTTPNRPMGCKKIIEKCSTLLNGMCDGCKNKPKEKKEKEGSTSIPIPEIAGALAFENNYDLVEKA